MLRQIRNIIIIVFLILLLFFWLWFFWLKNETKQKDHPKLKKDYSLLKNETIPKINHIKKMNQNEKKFLEKINIIYSEWSNLISQTRILTFQEEQKLLTLEKQYQKTLNTQKKHRKWMEEYFLFLTFCNSN